MNVDDELPGPPEDDGQPAPGPGWRGQEPAPDGEDPGDDRTPPANATSRADKRRNQRRS